MKLYYWSKRPNFGDALNPWMWPQLFPKSLDECFTPETLLLGVGSCLDKTVPQPPTKIVFGTGTAYVDPPKTIDHTWNFYCVRGPLTASKIGIPEEKAITDSAILLRSFFDVSTSRTYAFSFMPHFQTALHEPYWSNVCQSLGINYINPEFELQKVVEMIRNSEVLITESLHGAITADTFRVPWTPIKTRPYINEFKWHDWCSSMAIKEHEFELVPPIGKTGGIFGYYQAQLIPLTKLPHMSRLKKIMSSGKRYLSSEAIFQEKHERSLACLNNMINDA